MSKYLLYLFFAAIIIMWIIMPSKKKQIKKKRKEYEQQKDDVQYIVDKANAQIDKMHNMRNMYQIKLEDLRQKAVKCGDMESMQMILTNCEDMNQYCIKMDEIIKKMQIAMENSELEEFDRLKNELFNISDGIEYAYEQLKFIVPEKQTNDDEYECDNNKKTAPMTGYFLGCTTEEELQKRYRALTKAFHPDTGFGDEDSFQKMQTEYEQKKKELSRN